jgi:hypothetical protein
VRRLNKLARETQISIRNLRKLDCFPQNRVPTFADRARSPPAYRRIAEGFQ